MARKNKIAASDAGDTATKKKPFYKRIWVWLVAGVIAIAAVNAAGDDDEAAVADTPDQEADEAGNADDSDAAAEDAAQDEAAEDEAAAEAEEPAADEDADGGESFGVGDSFAVNDWSITINSVGERTPTIGDEFLNTEAQGEFLPVDLTVTNDGSSGSHFFASDFVAVDDQDREFNYSSDATIYGASDGAVSLLDEINPGNSIEGTLYFDVPEGTDITALDINAGFLSDPVRVSLN